MHMWLIYENMWFCNSRIQYTSRFTELRMVYSETVKYYLPILDDLSLQILYYIFI